MTALPAILAPVIDDAASPRALKESWRYTSLHAVEGTHFKAAAPISIAQQDLPPVLDNAVRLLFVNGVFDAMNSAKFPDGVAFEQGRLTVERGASIAQPLELLLLSVPSAEPTVRTIRLDLKLGENASAVLIENHRTLGHPDTALLTLCALAIELGENARLSHLRLQQAGPSELHFARSRVALAAQAAYTTLGVTLGAAQSRYQMTASLRGAGASAKLAGLYLQKDAQRCETVTSVDHLVPHCESEQKFRGIVAGKAKATFLGRIAVARDAQKTVAYQSHKALPLSATAEINAKPELEIFADDVKCSHGVAIGAIDEAALFYLRSRGVPAAQARMLLVEGFIEELLTSAGDDRMIARAREAVAAWLSAVGGKA